MEENTITKMNSNIEMMGYTNEIEDPGEERGNKNDEGKLRYDLLPSKELEKIVKVLTFGAEKYGAGNWQLVESARERYTAGLMRHLEKYRQGEEIDAESGLEHLAHLATNAMFLMWFEENKNKK